MDAETVSDTVITLPVNFNDSQRPATKDGGRIAGLLQRLENLTQDWQAVKAELEAINNSDLAAINAWTTANQVRYVANPGS